MLVHFRTNKAEVVTRNYDLTGAGFSALPASPIGKILDESQKFQWSVGLVKDLLAIFSSIALSSIGYGILMVMIALRLEANVKNEILMSLCAATQIGAGVIFSRFLPIFGERFGLVKSIYIGSILSAIFALALYKYLGYFPLLITIFILGTSFFICGVTRNTIMIDLAPTHVRSIIISIGVMLVAIGNGVGPILLSLLKTGDSFTSFLVASGFYFASMIPLTRLKKVDSAVREQKKISTWRYIKNSPKIMFAAFCVNFCMSSTSAFAIIYGIRIGMPAQEASLLLPTLLFGTILYIPIGYLSDILNRRFLMITFAILSLLCAISLYYNGHNNHEIHTSLFLLFGCLAGVKLPAIVLINEKYKPTQRLAVNSAFSRISLTGNICGLFTTGFIMNSIGPQGLWVSLMIILVLFIIFCFGNYSKKIKSKEMKIADFSIFKQTQSEPAEL